MNHIIGGFIDTSSGKLIVRGMVLYNNITILYIMKKIKSLPFKLFR